MSDTKKKPAKSKTPGKGQNKKKLAKKLNLQHQQFIDNYTDINNTDTFNNATQSYLQTYPKAQYNTAQVQSSRLLSTPMIQGSIEALIDELNMGAKVRLNTINQVLTGRHEQKTTTTSQDKDGNEYTATTVKSPTASDTLKAVDLLAKIDGTYDKNKAKADVVSTELKELIRAQRKDLTGKQGRGKS